MLIPQELQLSRFFLCEAKVRILRSFGTGKVEALHDIKKVVSI